MPRHSVVSDGQHSYLSALDTTSLLPKFVRKSLYEVGREDSVGEEGGEPASAEETEKESPPVGSRGEVHVQGFVFTFLHVHVVIVYYSSSLCGI